MDALTRRDSSAQQDSSAHHDTSPPRLHRLSAWDGLVLTVREWGGGADRRPLLCLPGIVRTGGDFAGVAVALGEGRRVIAPDYAGRGESGRARRVDRYAAEACVRDILDICAALHVHGAIGIGTSFGGLLCMGIAAARPSLLHAVVLNDIGPDISGDGTDFVRRFIATDPALPDLAACTAYLRKVLPPLALASDAEWEQMARLTYAPALDGLWHPLWDTRLAQLLQAPAPDLWPLFGALAHMKLLLVRGEASDILLPDTVARMQAARPDMAVVSLPGIGHAPTLGEPGVVAALHDFLDRIG
ncbi:MAG TPA: alpha/beta hydrolase [Acetobacteraceae bacterium]|nr:alpha/beta hydrolase [Acetobacteraceae bacterium]